MQRYSIAFPIETDDLMLYYGDKQRYSSMTSVALLSDNLLAAASYCNKQLFLVRFDFEKATHQILDVINTAGPTDLMECRRNGNDDGGGEYVLLTSDFNNCSVSLYQVSSVEEKLKLFRTIRNAECGPCHGVEWWPGDDDVVLFTATGTKNPMCGVYALRLSDPDGMPFFALQERDPSVPLIGCWLAKDVTFAAPDLMIAMYCNSAPNWKEKRRYSTKLVTYLVDIRGNRSRRLAEHLIPNNHGDACVFRNGKLYATLEDIETGGHVAVFNVDGNGDGAFTQIDDVKDYSFPHGVDARFGLLAVSEYGNSTIVLAAQQKK